MMVAGSVSAPGSNKDDVCCVFLISTLYQVKEIPFYSQFDKFFCILYHEHVLDSIKCFSALARVFSPLIWSYDEFLRFSSIG